MKITLHRSNVFSNIKRAAHSFELDARCVYKWDSPLTLWRMIMFHIAMCLWITGHNQYILKHVFKITEEFPKKSLTTLYCVTRCKRDKSYTQLNSVLNFHVKQCITPQRRTLHYALKEHEKLNQWWQYLNPMNIHSFIQL